MRIRRKKWAEKELQESNFYIDKPDVNIGTWNTKFKNNDLPLYLELGCGKGLFMANLAHKNLGKANFIAVDMIEAMLGLSKRNIESVYENKDPENLLLIRANVENLLSVFEPGKDVIDRIYINFCNPWPKKKHKKRRLTHTRQLEQYKQLLNENGQIYFKTDSDELFEESLEYFNECSFTIKAITYDLHQEDIFDGNIETEHEKMFSDIGIKIKALIAEK